jgi:DNA repair protein RadC
MAMEKTGSKLGIKGWAAADRPREKLLIHGRRQLTDAELIAILIRSGTETETAVDVSKRILSSYANDLNKLAKLDVKELSKFNGIGLAKSITIVAAFELGRRKREMESSQPQKIISSSDAYKIIKPILTDLFHEEFWVILLNRGNVVIGMQLISKGGQSAIIIDPKVVFKVALEKNAAAMILAHNHPSGSLSASRSDIKSTKKLIAAGVMLELRVLDHLIITNDGYLSMADEKLMS